MTASRGNGGPLVATGAQSDATMTKSDSDFVLTETLQFLQPESQFKG